MSNRVIQITNKGLIEPQHKCEHEPYEYNKYEVTKRSKESQCYVAIYEIPPKKANYPYHYHLKNEEVFYIISGSGLLETPDGNKNISAGDIVVCPPSENGAHRIINNSQTETLVYLDFDTVNSPEVVFYPNSDKVGVIVQGESSTFYRKNTNVDYYEGE
ncbi:cupin domain-containing protein [Lutispora saccharofermentans]|uniref:Cupin domain-containing protein n=1 Tax=Lutispora saccharofermentans TaxID=3024236 RepID=A0ABT1NFD0_9FIRM|nr:cupin domain-containing protein [Lutispora saccharofermentans]MCQ1529942.1 cupin domain-containing protein [Lutispora saccharofermentans]